MRVNVLQHTPNEGPGAIKAWTQENGHQLYVYHPYQFNGILPTEAETDMLVILGGPMSPNDEIGWIKDEQQLILQLMDKKKPIFGACFGGQQIAKALGYQISKAPYKEVGWAPVYLQSNKIKDVPGKLVALHWHEEMFEIPNQAELLFSSDLVKNQGFLLDDTIIGLQFHFEPEADDVREIVINDGKYAEERNALKQSPEEILAMDVPEENKQIMFYLLDYISQNKHM